MATLKEAIIFAKQNPNEEKSKQLLEGLKSGKFDSIAQSEGIDLSKFKKNLSPMNQTSGAITSVAEREGWLSHIGNAMQQYADMTGLSDKKPGETITKPLREKEPVNQEPINQEPDKNLINNLSSTQSADLSKAMAGGLPESDVNEYIKKNFNVKPKEEEGPGLFGRIKNALSKTKDAYVREANRLDLGKEMVEGADRNTEQLEGYKKRAEEKLSSGEYTQEQYDKTMAYIEPELEKFKDTRQVGSAKVFRGGASTFGAPIEGLLLGGFEPEVQKGMEYIGEKIADSDRASEVVQKLTELAEEHPALTDVFAGITELAGIKGGGKILKKGGEATLDAAGNLKKVGPNIMDKLKSPAPGIKDKFAGFFNKAKETGDNLMRKVDDSMDPNILKADIVDSAGDAVKGLNKTDLTEGSGLFERLKDKLYNRKVDKDVKKLEKTVEPNLVKKEVQEALLDDRFIPGETGRFKGLFSGRAPDVVTVSNNVKKGLQTIAENIKGAAKLNDVKLYQRLRSEISDLSNKLKPQLQNVNLKPEVIDKVKDTWAKTKKMQLDDVVLQSFPGLKRAQTNFDNIINSITKSVRGPDGKFRTKTLNDLWEISKDYDKTVKNAIKNASKVQSETAQFYQQVWEQNRQILRDFLKQEASDMGIDARKMFEQMNDYYTVQNEIYRLIKPNKGVDSGIKRITKKYVAPAVVGTTAYGVTGELLGD